MPRGLVQSHSRCNRLLEIFGCDAFHLRWKQALLDPSACDFTNPEDYDALNKVESNNYNLDYYVLKENLAVTFVEELEVDTKTQGGGSHLQNLIIWIS